MTDRPTAPRPEWRRERLFLAPDLPPADDHDEDDE